MTAFERYALDALRDSIVPHLLEPGDAMSAILAHLPKPPACSARP